MANDYPIYYREWQETEDISSEDRKIKVFKNTIETLNNRITANSHYTTWFRFKFGDFEIDTSSNNPNRQFMTSFQHNLSGAGEANKFILNIAYDPFKYGQEPNASISKIEEYFCGRDNVIDKTVDAVKKSDRYKSTSDNIYSFLQCEFQYGYSEPINMVSPKYTAFVSAFTPNIVDGIILYTIEVISGTAYISGGKHSEAEFPDRNNAKPLEVVRYELWRYFGNPKQKPAALITDPEGKELNEDSCVNNSGIFYDIDVPDDLIMHSVPMKISNSGGSISVMTYLKELLASAIDDRYKEEMKPDSEDSDRRPFYAINVTDSGSKKISVSLVVPSVKDTESLVPESNTRVTGITFNWMNQKNSIVTKWTTKVDGKLMIITANSNSKDKAYINSSNDVVKLDSNVVQPLSVIPTPDDNSDYNSNPAIDAQISETMRRAQTHGSTATIGLVGLPCEIPLGAYLHVDAKYNESLSYTSGAYMIMKSSTFISDSGVFSTEINLHKVVRYTQTYKNQEDVDEDVKQESTLGITNSKEIANTEWDKEPEKNRPSGWFPSTLA